MQGFVVNGNDLALGPVEDAQYVEVPNNVADASIRAFLEGEEYTIFNNAERTISVRVLREIFDRAYTLCFVGGNRGSLEGDEFDVALYRLNAEMAEAINHGATGPQE